MTGSCVAQKARWPPEGPFLREAYVFGAVIEGADPVDRLEVAFVLDLPSEKVRWGSHPPGADWLVDVLRLDKDGGYVYWWRSRHEPVWNHHISGPVRFWSLDGTDEKVLTAMSERRFDDLPRVAAEPAEVRARTTVELDAALVRRLRDVHRNYWERDWHREHRGNYRYPENERTVGCHRRLPRPLGLGPRIRQAGMSGPTTSWRSCWPCVPIIP